MKQVFFRVILIALLGCSQKKETLVKEDLPRAGWEIIGQCSADFNKDKVKDHAYIMEEKVESSPDEADECMSGQPFHRKELLIRFGEKDGEGLDDYTATNIFGQCNWGVQGTDAFAGIGVRKNTLKLKFIVGGTLRSHLSYYFRYQDNDWYLIGYDEATYQVPNPDQYIKEINYLTGKKITYEIISDKKGNEKTFSVGKKKLIKLDELNVSEHNEAGRE